MKLGQMGHILDCAAPIISAPFDEARDHQHILNGIALGCPVPAARYAGQEAALHARYDSGLTATPSTARYVLLDPRSSAVSTQGFVEINLIARVEPATRIAPADGETFVGMINSPRLSDRQLFASDNPPELHGD